ncbi:hypothetical protein CYMTET_32538 [Cymbomonas tetramitiformis]|uniref:Uncharacterized protein n=1 Tax=Cymbomonas tetramitiformis TaxID=36881 RepID=A0AAE0FEU4_9CHLO|nr:hypothetical protein CYMTET_32538 [Cymbomonas tetramitiformis]
MREQETDDLVDFVKKTAGDFLLNTRVLTVEVFKLSAPFVTHGAISALSFTSSLAATQAIGRLCRVSCATPILGPALGTLGVGTSAVIAGQASATFSHWRVTGNLPPMHGSLGLPVAPQRDLDYVVDALIGVAFYRILGGRLASVLPSDLRFAGALARESIRAPGSSYANEVQRAELRMLFKRFGCHHCGTRRGDVVGDHMPPNKFMKESLDKISKGPMNMGKVFSSFRFKLPRGKIVQRYYPQCSDCSNRQGAAIRQNTQRLQMHFGGFQHSSLAAIVLGMRYYHPLYPA